MQTTWRSEGILALCMNFLGPLSGLYTLPYVISNMLTGCSGLAAKLQGKIEAKKRSVLHSLPPVGLIIVSTHCYLKWSDSDRPIICCWKWSFMKVVVMQLYLLINDGGNLIKQHLKAISVCQGGLQLDRLHWTLIILSKCVQKQVIINSGFHEEETWCIFIYSSKLWWTFLDLWANNDVGAGTLSRRTLLLLSRMRKTGCDIPVLVRQPLTLIKRY